MADSLLQVAFSCALYVLHGDPVAERCACVGIEVQPPFLAPLFELGRFDDGTNDMLAFVEKSSLQRRSASEPIAICCVQGVAIGHQPLDLLEILFLVPGHAQHLDRD